jgi:hypothetical protein
MAEFKDGNTVLNASGLAIEAMSAMAGCVGFVKYIHPAAVSLPDPAGEFAQYRQVYVKITYTPNAGGSTGGFKIIGIIGPNEDAWGALFFGKLYNKFAERPTALRYATMMEGWTLQKFKSFLEWWEHEEWLIGMYGSKDAAIPADEKNIDYINSMPDAKASNTVKLVFKRLEE